MLNFDTSRAPSRPTEVQTLVLAVRDADPSDESTWLEWKSSLDWQGKGARVHIARAILGFANRMPDDASRHVEGHGFLIIGAEPGAIHGVERPDPVDLDQQVTPFLGEDGPRWHPHFLTVEGRSVLVIDIDPPQWGDPIHAARKTSDNIVDGWVLVRGKGGTKQATSAQMDALQRRLSGGVTEQQMSIALEVLEPAAVIPLDTDAAEWLRDEETQLLRAMPDPSGIGEITRLAGFLGEGFRDVPEDRTEAQYRQQVADYIDLCRQRLPRVLALAASSELPPLFLRAQNLTDKNLPDLLVELHIEGAVEAVLPDRVALETSDRLPPPPRTWGPRPNPALGALGGYGLRLPSVPFTPNLNPRPRPHIENGGSTTIEFPAVDLRPRRSADLDEIVLLVHEAPGSMLQATWSATSSGSDGTVTGELSLPVDPTAWTVADWASSDDE